jgi:hypothetical protein
MHLLREGQFGVANTFIAETSQTFEKPPSFVSSAEADWERKSESLQLQFGEMYHVLDEIKNNHNLNPAIAWARENSQVLDSRGSNLEFELCRLQFVTIFLGDQELGSDEDAQINGTDSMYQPNERVMQATEYARQNFSNFHTRYAKEVYALIGAVAFWQTLTGSPYQDNFTSQSAWEDVASSFTREFCALLGLSAHSPLYIAATAGAIALPVLNKMKAIMKAKRTEWTTEGELPTDVPLPPGYSFHSIFVCPVSKEQATDQNPPMMLVCGHVLCNDSMKSASKGSRFKCPYCPVESHPKDAKKLYL